MTNIAVLVSGSGSNLQAIIHAIENGYISDAQIKCVISNKENAFGLERARKHNIKSVFLDSKGLTREEYTDKLIELLKEDYIDLICLAGFMLILSPQIVKAFPNKIMNIHPALLPKFGGKGMYGHYVHEAVIKSNDNVSGATVHFVDQGCDTGPIIIQERINVYKDDTSLTLAKKVLKIEHKIYPEAVKMFVEGKIKSS